MRAVNFADLRQDHASHSFEKWGFRFWKCACMASFKSSETSIAEFHKATYSNPCATVRSRDLSSTAFVPITARGDFTAISFATFITFKSSSAFVGNTPWTSPTDCASVPLNVLPVSASSMEMPWPTSLGRRWRVPRSAVIARSTSFTEKLASWVPIHLRKHRRNSAFSNKRYNRKLERF